MVALGGGVLHTVTSSVRCDETRKRSPEPHGLILQKVFIKSLCKSQLPHKTVNYVLVSNRKQQVDEFVGKFTF